MLFHHYKNNSFRIIIYNLEHERLRGTQSYAPTNVVMISR